MIGVLTDRRALHCITEYNAVLAEALCRHCHVFRRYVVSICYLHQQGGGYIIHSVVL